MTDYSFNATALMAFCASRECAAEGDELCRWADLVDSIGPSSLPFVIKRSALADVPFPKLGIQSIDPASLRPKRGEMWILFCYSEEIRSRFEKDGLLRSDGFPLVLEWRKDVQDSPLLSTAFRRLADLVRKQLNVEGWGLWPSFDRYGDKVDFVDPDLFGVESDLSQVASAYGALVAGLFCAIRNRFPPEWTFPTLQWDWDRGETAGVAGIESKITVAADFGARYVSVAAKQVGSVRATQKELMRADRSCRLRRLSIVPVTAIRSPMRLAEVIAFRPYQRRRLFKTVVAALVLIAMAFSAFVWDQNREVVEFYRGVEDRFGVCLGVDKLSLSEAKKLPFYYCQTYQGFGKGGYGHRRLLRSTSFFGPNGRLRNEPNSRSAMRKYTRDKDDRMLEVEFYDESLRRIGLHKYIAGVTNVAEMIDFDEQGERAGLENEKMVIEYHPDGRKKLARQFFATGEYKEVYPIDSPLEVREEYFDVDGSRMLNSDGAAIVRRRFGADNMEIAKSFYDCNDKPTLCYKGYHCESNVFDFATQSKLTIFLGKDGKPCVTSEGTAMGRMWFGNGGEVVRCVAMNEKGELVEVKSNGLAGYQIERSQTGETVKTFIGANGNIKVNEIGYARVRYGLDQKTGMRWTRFYDANDNLHTNETGVYGWNSLFDSRGNEIERMNVGLMGQAVENSEGWAFSIETFNERNQLESQTCLDASKQPVHFMGQGFGCSSGRCERITCRHGRNGKMVSTAFAQKGTGSFWGADSIEFVSDLKNRPYRITFRDNRGSKINSALGFSVCEVKYDAFGEFSEACFFDRVGELVCCEVEDWGLTNVARIHRKVRRKFDGIVEQWRFFNDKDLPSANPKLNGAVMLEFHYDRFGDLVEGISYDINLRTNVIKDVNQKFKRRNGFVPFALR